MSKFEPDESPLKNIKANIEVSNKLPDSVRPIVEQQEHLNKMTKPLKEVSEQYKDIVSRITLSTSRYEQLTNLQKSIAEMQLNTTPIAIDAISDSLKSMSLRLAPLYSEIPTTELLEAVGNTLTSSIAVLMQNIISNFSSELLEAIQSPFLDWIKSFDFSPWTRIFENLQLPDLEEHKDELDEIYLRAMYDADWFPYVARFANLDLYLEINEILGSSRGMSNRCKSRIDRAVLAYYTPKEIREIKRSWRGSDLKPHIRKILCQALDAHLRGEFALTITCLATMWEGLIRYRTNVDGRQSSKKTNADFKLLISKNDIEPIFSDYYEKLIVSQVNSDDDAKDGVPNRNGISHSKYKNYPNKKASLNAILLTDFIISLSPQEISEEDKHNG